jgi:hypothetical protein
MPGGSVKSETPFHLAAFEPSEQEFREIFKLWRDYAEEIFYSAGQPNAADSAQTKALPAETKAGIKALLGEQRQAGYVRSTDPAYAALCHVTEGQGVPKNTVLTACEIESRACKQKWTLDLDSSVSPEQRNDGLRALRAEADPGGQPMEGWGLKPALGGD